MAQEAGHDPSAAARALDRVYGACDWARRGVVHVAAVWQHAPGELVTIRIGPAAPSSAWDELVLRGARACADVIVITGEILRAEPTLAYDLVTSLHGDALHAWRRDTLGKPEPPRVVVLTRGRDLPLDHPALHGWALPSIYTSHEGAARLRARAPDPRIAIIGVDEPSPRAVVAFARDVLGACTILIEAGPSAAASLYEQPALVDELLLSVFESTELPAPAQGPPFIPWSDVTRALVLPSRFHTVREPSGSWRFMRLTRA